MFRFRSLTIWKASADLIDPVFEFADRIEQKRQYRFAEQLRSAMLSVPNNIAEGSGSRSNKDFQHFLNIAHRSVFETASMLLVLERRSVLKKEEAEEALERLDHLARQIVRFSSTL